MAREGEQEKIATSEFKYDALNQAIDRAVDRKYNESPADAEMMARIFMLDEKSIAPDQVQKFQAFVQLTLQQIAIGWIKTQYRLTLTAARASELAARLDNNELPVDPGAGLYHDVLHAMVARMMRANKGGVQSLRPRYYHETAASNKKNDLQNTEEDLATFFTMNLNQGYQRRESLDAMITRITGEHTNTDDQYDAFMQTVFRRGNGATYRVAKNMPHIVSMMRDIFTKFPTDKKILLQYYSQSARGLV